MAPKTKTEPKPAVPPAAAEPVTDLDRVALAFRATGDGIWDWNLKTNQVHFSGRWKQMLGLEDAQVSSSPEEWLGRVHPEDVHRLEANVAAHVGGTEVNCSCEHRLRYYDGSYRWYLARGLAVRADDGSIARLVGTLTDIHDRKQVEERLAHDAFHDTLTGLPNRSLFQDRVRGCLARAQRRTVYMFAVLFLDLDRFKNVNDGLGHAVGDKVLIEMGRLLQACIRPEDTVARIGGDEFTILLDGIEDLSAATRVAIRVQNALQAPMPIDGHDVFTTCSLGIALSTSGYERPEEIIRDADTAMYRAKTQGKNRYQVFDISMHERASALLQLETDLRHAVDRNEFVVHYQAIRSLSTGETVGFEALVRWIHPTRGMISPAEFIPVAEETGLIVPIGWTVLNEACKQMKEWRDRMQVTNGLFVSVNLSTGQFAQPGLVASIIHVLRETGLDPSALKLEITESVVIQSPESANEILRQLRALGIRVAIDDFGTGYSSLAYLLRYPIDTLKIDRSFISGLGSGISNSAIVETIVTLAHTLGMDVIAEGVETQEQLDHLRLLNCESAQGFLFAKPTAHSEAFGQVTRS